MVKVIDRLPTEEEEMKEVRNLFRLAKKYYNGKDVEVYYPRGGSWFSVRDKNGEHDIIYVYPLRNLIECDYNKTMYKKALNLATLFEKDGSGEFSVLRS